MTQGLASASRRRRSGGNAPAHGRLWHEARQNAPWLLALGWSAGQAFGGFDSPAGMAWSCLVNASLLGACAVLFAPAAGITRAMAPALGALAVTFGWALVATAINNPAWPDFATPRFLSLCSAVFALCGAALYANATGPAGLRRLLDPMLGCACLAIGAAVVISAIDSGDPQSMSASNATYRFVGLIGNANISADIAAVFMLYAVARLLSTRSPQPGPANQARIGAVALPFALLLLVIVLFLSGSRSATVMALGGGIWLALGFFRPQNWPKLPPYRLAAPALAVALAVLWWCVGDIVSERFQLIGDDWGMRVELWRHVAGLVGDQPLTGYGLGTYSQASAHALTTPRMAQKFWAVNSAHNLVLQVMMVGGLPYLAGHIVAATLILRPIVATIPVIRRAGWVVLLAMPLVLLGASAVDIALDMPVTVTLFAVLIGLLWGLALTKPKARITPA